MNIIRRLPGLRFVGFSALAALAVTALIGFAHTPMGRPLLNALRGAPGCPVDLDGGDPRAIEAGRAQALAKVRGSVKEHSRPALAFELARSTRAEVERHMRTLGAQCEPARENSVLRCSQVPASLSALASPPIVDLHLQFDLEGRLVAADLFRAGTDAESAFSALTTLEGALQQRVGEPTQRYGDRTAEELAVGPFHLSAIRYRYESYVAELSATNFGAEGVRIREQYQFVPRIAVR